MSAGVRFAHFTKSRQVTQFQQTQGMHFESSTFATYSGYGTRRHELWTEISAKGGEATSFKGLGPSVQWEASALLWGSGQGGLSLDWGVNAAILFGKQKKAIHYQSSSVQHCGGSGCPATPAMTTNEGAPRSSRTVTVPNIGGFMGLSLKFPKAEFSLGYRADLFMNAMEVGFDTRKSSNLLFNGPYASNSLGIGG